MSGKTPIRTLATLALLVVATLAAGAAGAEPAVDCPSGVPWSRELPLDYPPSIVPGADGAIDTTFVVRKRDLCVPEWTTQLCQGTYTACTTDGDCGAGSPAGTCGTTMVCGNTETSCTKDADCSGQSPGNRDCIAKGAWFYQAETLRSYGFPKDPAKPVDPSDPDDPNLRWGYPGPTLRARAEQLKNPDLPPSATNPQVKPGTRIKLALHNYLEPVGFHEGMECNPASYMACDGTTTVCAKDSDCPTGVACVETPFPQTAPECFHGDSVTNLHYHGTHVSPQPHQDFVLLSLYPYGSTDVPAHGDSYAVGSYRTDINPLPWNQAPGTHWYHPHKHGSTSVQVLNGMAGALLIGGAFDDWLEGAYEGKLLDRLLIVQQVTADLNFFNKGIANYPPQVLINGLASPKITMRPGEIQRWRFVGATMQVSASLEIGFDPRIQEVRQIAQDGVQFVAANYDQQPYRDREGGYVNFKLSPGNRADFLIQAPAAPGTYSVGSRIFAQGLAADVMKKLVRQLEMQTDVEDRIPPMEGLTAMMASGKPPINPANGNPLLFTIEVGGPPVSPAMKFPVTAKTDPACAGTPRPARCWPATPSYLENLDPPGAPPRQVAFSIAGDPGGAGAVGKTPNAFYINDTQYRHDCAGATMTLGSIEDWVVSNQHGPGNTFLLPHPFHIHINPFQVLRNGDRTFDPPVWQDTIALPTKVTTDRPAGPIFNNDDAKVKCPRACAADMATWNGQWRTTIPGKLSVCGCVENEPSVQIRHRFDDYTGGYVIHCHFLGHEDRGMMWNVQTVCPPQNEVQYGATQQDGGPDDCANPHMGLPGCPASPCASCPGAAAAPSNY